MAELEFEKFDDVIVLYECILGSTYKFCLWVYASNDFFMVLIFLLVKSYTRNAFQDHIRNSQYISCLKHMDCKDFRCLLLCLIKKQMSSEILITRQNSEWLRCFSDRFRFTS